MQIVNCEYKSYRLQINFSCQEFKNFKSQRITFIYGQKTHTAILQR